METSDHTIGNEAEYLWDVDEADRFAKLALRYHYLLTHDEQIVWKLIRENGYLWKGHYSKATGVWTWTVEEDSLIFARLREHWENFNAVAAGKADKAVLPQWAKIKVQTKESKVEEFDDDIPF